MLKASPTGGLFNLSSGVSSMQHGGGAPKTCAGHGYTVAGGPDVCTPGVDTFFRTTEDQGKYKASVQTALESYAERYQLPLKVATLMASCVCAPGSDLMTAAGAQCASGLAGIIGAWVHQDPFNGHLMMRDQGPFVFVSVIGEPSV